ncbi:MAG: O-antigen ligase family protein [Mogibacterium sp.]|nr:O-antigen ligase family protein [Mogibacterium sp.]
MDHTRNSLICGFVLVILVICSIKAPLKKVRWDPILFYLFFIAGLGIVAISFLHPVGKGYRAFGLMMMVGFPCLYYVWNNRGDYDTLYKRLSFATCFVGLLFFIYCMRLAANRELHSLFGRVDGFLRNANMFSMIGMVMVCASLYMFTVNKKSVPWFIFSAVSFSIGWEIILLGVSRLSILVGAGGIFSFIIFGIKTRIDTMEERGRFGTVSKIAIVVISMIVSIAAGSLMLSINNRPIEESAATSSGSAVAEAQDNSQKPADDTVSVADRFDTTGMDANAYTAGRITIWKSYAAHLNMWGNSFDRKKIHEITGSVIVHAHNNFLELGYRCGILVACIHILLELYAGIICVIFLFGKRYREPYYLFAIIFMICYAVESMFDIATLPFERHAPFFFYMALITVFGRNAEEFAAPRHMRKD